MTSNYSVQRFEPSDERPSGYPADLPFLPATFVTLGSGGSQRRNRTCSWTSPAYKERMISKYKMALDMFAAMLGYERRALSPEESAFRSQMDSLLDDLVEQSQAAGWVVTEDDRPQSGIAFVKMDLEGVMRSLSIDPGRNLLILAELTSA